MDFAPESGMVLIPTRFAWRYGGRIVCISGSFTGWTQWPMTPLEGCPTVFQTIFSLPPGYHQFKFIVDGEWRHDEKLPFVSSNIGNVNTILLARESSFLHADPSISMDVDNEAFQGESQVQFLDRALPQSFPRMSSEDLEISRHRVAVFLATHFSYEMLPESGKVIALDIELPVKQAFHILHEQGISMAPLWDFLKGKFVGVLSALDFILIMKKLGSHGSNLTGDELETHTISAWKEAKLHLNSQINGKENSGSKRLIQAGPDENLKEVALKIIQNGFSTIPIIHSPSEGISHPQLLHLASLSGILKCLCRFIKHSPSSLPVLQMPICAIPVGTWVPKIGEPNGIPLAMLRPSASLSSALNLLVQAQLSSIPIVDGNDSLVDVYSRSDITALVKDKIYTHVNLEETTIQQALQYRDEPFSTFGHTNKKCHMCLRSDSLHKVMERLSIPGVRRLVIVEAGSKRVEGIISLSDVFQFLLVVK